MANVGGGAAYQKLQVPKDGISQAMQYWGGQQANRVAADKLAKERAGVRKQKRDDEMIAGMPVAALDAEMTGRKDLDSVTIGLVERQRARYNELKRSARIKQSSGDELGFREDEDKMRQINSSFATWNNLIKTVKPQIEEYMTNIDQYNPNDQRFKIHDAIIRNNMIPYQDDEGNMKIILGIDTDADGEVSDEERKKANSYIRDGAQTGELEYEVIDGHDLIQGFYEQYKKVSINEKDGMLDQLAASTGMATKNEKTGSYEMTKTTGFDETKFEELKNAARQELADPEKAAWVMNTALGIKDKDGNLKVEGFSPEEMDEAAEWLTKQTIARFPSTSSTEFLSSKYSTDSANNKSNTGNSTKIKITPLTDVNEVHLDNAYNIRDNRNNPIKGIMRDSDESTISAVKIVGDKVMALVKFVPVGGALEEVDEILDGTASKESEWKDLNKTELGNLSLAMGFGDVGKMKKHLDKIGSGYKKKNSSTNNNDPLDLGI